MTYFSLFWLQFSWFFFELIVKSMAQHLVDYDKLKVKYQNPLLPLLISSITDHTCKFSLHFPSSQYMVHDHVLLNLCS